MEGSALKQIALFFSICGTKSLKAERCIRKKASLSFVKLKDQMLTPNPGLLFVKSELC